MSLGRDITIAMAADHGGAELKQILYTYITERGYNVRDFGVQCGETAQYPVQAALVADALLKNEADKGILLCGSGIGISIAANRFSHIRAALCHDEYGARMSRLHNDSNVLVLGGRTTGVEVAKAIADVWLNTEFEGGRHTARVAMLAAGVAGTEYAGLTQTTNSNHQATNGSVGSTLPISM